MSIRLGLNIDHVATLRNARGEAHPNPLELALEGIAGGADSITIHLREDRRHILDQDVFELKANLPVPINFEMAATLEMRDIALKVMPKAACIVPEKREERTTEGGLDLNFDAPKLKQITQSLVDAGIRVSLFIEPDATLMAQAVQLGAKAVELHTGRYAQAIKLGDGALEAQEFANIKHAAEVAHGLGLEVHAGHGLDYVSAERIAHISQIVELNIGHFLVGEALKVGLQQSVRNMCQVLSFRSLKQPVSGA